MVHHVAESAIGAGPMATLTELRDVDAPHGVRSRVESWRSVPLQWGDHAARSLLLQAFAASGILASYLLTLQLAPPPAFGALAALKGLAVLLLMLATIVAPIELLYRCIAVWCVVLYAATTFAWVLKDSTEIFGRSLFSELDGIEVAAYGIWVIAYLVMRMRHPMVIAVAMVTYCVVAVALCTRVLPDVRIRLLADGINPITTIADEIVLRVTMLTVGLMLVALAWWLDGWVRPMLPLRVPESIDNELEASLSAVVEPGRRAWISVACFLDPLAIYYGHQALLAARVLGIRGHDEFMIRAALGIAYTRLVLTMNAAASLLVIYSGTMWIP